MRRIGRLILDFFVFAAFVVSLFKKDDSEKVDYEELEPRG